MDGDEAGKSSVRKAIDDGLLTEDDVVFASVLGKVEAELEDLIQPAKIREAIADRFKVDIDDLPTGLRKRKFSTRCQYAFEKAGRPWSSSTKIDIKSVAANLINSFGFGVIHEDRRAPLLRLSEIITERLGRAS